MMPAIVIRPQPGCDSSVEAARSFGLEAHGFPLFAIKPVAWHCPQPETFDALLLGSANAPRHAGPALEAYRNMPAYVVGRATAAAAELAGLKVIAIGSGGLDGVLPKLSSGHRRLLRLSGREHIKLTPPLGVSIDERIVYASEPLPLPPALRRKLAAPAVVMIHSAEAASHFANLVDDQHVPRSGLSLAALGPRIAKAAGDGWRAVKASNTPSDSALLALTWQMCQKVDE